MRIQNIHGTNTIDLLTKNKVILPDNFINQPIDKQKRDLKKLCEAHDLTPIFKINTNKR